MAKFTENIKGIFSESEPTTSGGGSLEGSEINDTTTSTTRTWSSKKTKSELDAKVQLNGVPQNFNFVAEGEELTAVEVDGNTYTFPTSTAEVFMKERFSKIYSVTWKLGTISSGQVVSSTTRMFTEGFLNPKTDFAILQRYSTKRFQHLICIYNLDGTFVKDTGWVDGICNYIEFNNMYKYKIVIRYAQETAMNIEDTLNTLVMGEANNKIGELCAEILKEKRYIAVTAVMGYSTSNTLEAIEISKMKGAYGVELDVRLTKDDMVVLMHNETFSNNYNEQGNKKISEYTLSELTQFKNIEGAAQYYDYDIKIPTLREALLKCKELGLVVFIDLKADGYESVNHYKLIDIVYSDVVKTNMLDRSVFISPTINSLNYVKTLNEGANSSVKFGVGFEKYFNYARAFYRNTIIQPEYTITEEEISKIRQSGIPINCFYANNVDIKMISDNFTVPYKRDVVKNFKFTTKDKGVTWELAGLDANEYIIGTEKFNGDDAINIKMNGVPDLWYLSHNPKIEIYGNAYNDILIGNTIHSGRIVFPIRRGSSPAFGNLPDTFYFGVSLKF